MKIARHDRLVAGRGADARAPACGWARLRAGSITRAGCCALPNGDVLVAESNAPPKPDDATGIKGLDSEAY